MEFPTCINQCKENLNPSLLANYIYQLAKTYNKFYQKVPILDSSKNENFRLTLSKKVGLVIKNGMNILGVKVPNRAAYIITIIRDKDNVIAKFISFTP